MPWLKRIDLATARAECIQLHPGTPVVFDRRRRRNNVLSLRQLKGAVRIYSDPDGSDDWYATPMAFSDVSRGLAPEGNHFRAPEPVYEPELRLSHGAAFNAGDAAYVFLDKLEVRNASLEAAAVQSPEAARAWADWLEAQGDPYAAPLRAMLKGETFGRQQSWWLEALNRGMQAMIAEFDMRDGFLRRVALAGGVLPVDLHLLHLLSLRVAQGLEEIAIDLYQYAPAAFLLGFAQSDFWKTAPWPASLRSVRLSLPDAPYPGPQACADAIGLAMPGVRVVV